MISVIIPIYNSEKYLEKCINSVINQTYTDLQIILVNDGSSDTSGEICNKFALCDSRVQVFHTSNKGVSNARNLGLNHANGEYISFIDSDDMLEVDMYELLIYLMSEYDADISHCGYKRLNEQGGTVKEVANTHKLLIQNSEEAIECMLKGQYFVGGLWNKLFKREVLHELAFETNLINNEDILFNVLAFQNAKRIVFLDETKYLYFDHPTSACNNIKALRQIEDSIVATEKMINNINTNTLAAIYNERYYYCKINLLRYYIFNDFSKKDIRIIKGEIKIILNKGVQLSLKGRINYFLLLHLTTLYKIIYLIYDKIRKPNWDVK